MMTIGLMHKRWMLPGMIVVIAGAALSAIAATPSPTHRASPGVISTPAAAPESAQAATGAAGDAVKAVQSELLPNVPGKRLTAIRVDYAPGGKSPAHHHAGSVFAYVLTGSIRSEVTTSGPARVYKAGESFFEPPGSSHLVSENASATEPASLLAVFIADDGAKLTAPGKAGAK